MSKNRNENSTRYYSEKHENSVARALGGVRQPNSGAAKFFAGDVVTDRFLIECKTPVSEKDSFSIKKEWITKNRVEMAQIRKDFNALSFKFSPEGENLYIISERLMKVLVSTLEEREVD